MTKKPKRGPAIWTTMPNAVKRKTRAQLRKAELRQYSKDAHAYITDALLNPKRQWCDVAWTMWKEKILVSQVHHIRGRTSKLLLCQKYWMPVSARGHRFVHDNIYTARAYGWICGIGDWGKQP